MTMPRLHESFWAADRGVDLVQASVGALLAQRSVSHPDRLAVVGNRHGSGELARLTYRQLYSEASAVATALSRLAAPGSYVALWAPNVLEWAIIQYGAALAGMVLVPLNPVLRASELDYALRHSNAAVLLHADVSREYQMAEVAAQVAGTIPGLRRISLSDNAWRISGAEPQARVGPDDIAMVQYTSGTTGSPKGVVLTHRALVNVAKLTIESALVPTGAVCVNPLPMFHTAGCVISTLGPLWLGGTAVMIERFTPAGTLAVLRDEHADVLFYVPAILEALLAEQSASGGAAPCVPTVMGGAALVSAELIDRAAETFGATVLNLFGQTELAPVLSMTRPADSRDDRIATVGRPLPQIDCKITDPVTGELLPVGVPGEICARGYQQFVEYLKDPQCTAATVDSDGFVHTGDLGAMDDRGYLTVTGRLKDIIIRGGENIAPDEVERCLGKHSAVSELAVVGLPDDQLGEIIGAVVRLRADAGVDLKERLIEHARMELSAFKVPARWFIVEEFPVTSTGKVRRYALRDAILRGELREL